MVCALLATAQPGGAGSELSELSGVSEKFALKNAGGLASPLHPLALCVSKVSVRGHGISIIHSGRSTALHGLRIANLTSYAGRASFTAVGFVELFPSFPCADAWEIPSHPFTALTALYIPLCPM